MNTSFASIDDTNELDLLYHALDHLAGFARQMRHNDSPNLREYPIAKRMFVSQAKTMVDMAHESVQQIQAEKFETLLDMVKRNESYHEIAVMCNHLSGHVLDAYQVEV